LVVLNSNELPACIVECGFMSSATERAKLFDTEYQKKIAEGIANGIKKFLPLE
jgi:N-acetylmuramoyl-L-alanine amidase